MKITREFRFFLRPQGMAAACHNPWAGWNCEGTMAPWLKLQLTVEGPVDEQSGYLCDIRILDNCLRDAVANWSGQHASLAGFRYDRFLQMIRESASGALQLPLRPTAWVLVISPQLRIEIDERSPAMIEWTQQFEFSAAHRLHCPELDEAANRKLFGKCNNPAGHGHNYVVEVTVSCDPADSGAPFSPPEFERTVQSHVIDRLDHKHLNLDVAEFATDNPSVEQIASLIFRWLATPLQPLSLSNVRVYETPKTWADCGK